MSTPQWALSQGRANLALATLFLGMFVLGSGELLVVGVLNLIAADLEVSIPAAGTLVTVYALGLAIGGPILAALTMKLDKKANGPGTVRHVFQTPLEDLVGTVLRSAVMCSRLAQPQSG